MYSQAARLCRALILGGLLLLPACATSKTKPTVPGLSEYCQLPAQPPDPSSGQDAFSEYAWELFVALNWPAATGMRGVPDCNAAFGSPGPSVWESYKTTDELFLPDARDPGPWNTGWDAIRGLTQTLRFVAKAPAELPVEEAIHQAVGGWLTDQKANPTYYQIAVDEVSYTYVRDNRYYNADVVSKASRVSFPNDALEIKASWRIMEGVDESRYHTVQAEVMTFDDDGNPTGIYQEKTIGLVGLHIVYKPAGFPQWIWATFEQQDNAPDAADTNGANDTWSYFNPQCSGPHCTPNISPLKSAQSFRTPNQLTRLSPIRPKTADSNRKWQAMLAGTPFAFYQLVSPQWPSDPNNPGNPQGSPTPGTVANITMESYIQPTSSCMDCHSTARVPNGNIKSNYSFIFLFAKTPN